MHHATIWYLTSDNQCSTVYYKYILLTKNGHHISQNIGTNLTADVMAEAAIGSNLLLWQDMLTIKHIFCLIYSDIN